MTTLRHKFTVEQDRFIRETFPGISTKELAERFNQRFKTSLKFSQVRAYVHNHRITNGLDMRFGKGGTPHRPPKGKRFAPASEFKKGCRPQNWRPVGSERVNGEGYTDIKIAEPKGWKTKHSILWEAAHGPVPKGMKLIFKDGDKSHIALENIALVSNSEMAVLNRRALINADPELTETGILIAKVLVKASAIKHKQKEELKNA